MVIILHDPPMAWRRLLPFTALKPISDLRVGILTLKEKWELNDGIYRVHAYSSSLLGSKELPKNIESSIIISSQYLYSDDLLLQIKSINQNEGLFYKEHPIAVHLNKEDIKDYLENGVLPDTLSEKRMNREPSNLKVLEDLFLLNKQEITNDFKRITNNRISQPIPESNRVSNASHIFIEEGAQVENSILNASDGFIYIGKNAVILDGSMVMGSLAMAEASVLKMGAKIYGATTLGIGSKLGGEVKNSIIGDYTNKSHEGYLGNAVLGDWCNLGADTNASNLKSNYSAVRIWDYSISDYRQSEELFVGLMMGDHSKCGINTMFNTATVVGMGCNLYDAGFHPKYIPDFSWGTPGNYSEHKLEGFFKTANAMMVRKGKSLSKQDEEQVYKIFENSKKLRIPS